MVVPRTHRVTGAGPAARPDPVPGRGRHGPLGARRRSQPHDAEAPRKPGFGSSPALRRGAERRRQPRRSAGGRGSHRHPRPAAGGALAEARRRRTIRRRTPRSLGPGGKAP